MFNLFVYIIDYLNTSEGECSISADLHLRIDMAAMIQEKIDSVSVSVL